MPLQAASHDFDQQDDMYIVPTLPSSDTVVASYAIRAEACPQILGRITALFAQQDMIPDSISAWRTGDLMQIRLSKRDIPQDRAMIIAAKMRAMIMVQSATVHCV